MTAPDEIARRYSVVRDALERAELEAVVVCGNEYTGFEGAVRYLSGFLIVHRNAYVLLPREGEPAIFFPAEARYVGDHSQSWIVDHVFAESPGAALRERLGELGCTRVGIYGLDHVMAVRDYAPLADAGLHIVPFDREFDLARAVKSDAELESVRDTVRINEEGFWIFLETFEAGMTEAEILSPVEKFFLEQGCGRLTMNMVLVGANGAAEPEFKIASNQRRVEVGDLVLPSLEIAGPGGHWAEVSRAIVSGGPPNDDARRMLEAYEEYFETAREAIRPGRSAHDVHQAVSAGFRQRGYDLGHVTGHSIGMTMIEHPKIGEGEEAVLRRNMVLSMHPHALSEDGRSCMYMQDTWLVTPDGGEPLADLPMQIFQG